MSTPDSGPPGSESSSSSPSPAGRTCPHCGAVLPVDAPEGQCPACLLQNLTLEPSPMSATQPAEAPRPPSPPVSPAEIAPHFPQLEILECLGRGGMGVVYKARQKSLNRLVALKLLAPEREKDAAFAERFTREAQALALLSHSHIVTVYDFGITSPSSEKENTGNGFYYLLMEYVDGVNLRQLLDQRKLTPEEALAIVPSLCDALQYAHERGIVHRDIKPENLLLDRRGQVKIADFGIAKMMGNGTPSHTAAVEPKGAASPALGVTQPETALGTPAYMAPEQANAPERVDSRADIYSLGVVFYEMLTGELPAPQLDATSSRLRNLHIDVRLDEIVLRALEKKPEMRWQTAADLRTRIEEVSSASAVASPVLPSMPVHEEAVPAAAAPRPFRPWMQRFVARSFAGRRSLFWCLLIGGALLTACFMMPVSKYRAHPALIIPGEQQYLLTDKDEWIVRGEFGLPDAWWSETMRQATVPTVNADGKVVGRTAARGPQVERSVDLLTWSYAMGIVAALTWIMFWYCVAAEQRAGERLPPEQRAFASPLVDRSQGVRIRWWRVLTLFLAFCGMSIALSGHMTAIMMLLLGDAPTPAFNALWTTFFLSFALIKGLGQELAGAPSAGVGYGDLPVMPHTRPNASQKTAAAVGVVMAFIVPFLIYWLSEMVGGNVRDRFLITVFLVTWGVSTFIAHWMMRRRVLSDAVTRIWLRATSVCGWLLVLPVVGLAIFFAWGVASESSGWNPAPAEAFLVPAFWLGALLLPVASWYLWRVSGPPTVSQAPSGRSPWRVALGVFLLLAAFVAPLAYVASHAIEEARERSAFLRQKSALQQRASLEEANLDALQQSARDLQDQLARASGAADKERLQSNLDGVQGAVAMMQQARQASSAELREQLPPLSPSYLGFGLVYLILGSSACVALALLMFRRRSTGWYPRFILPVLLVVTVGYVTFAVSRLVWTASSHTARGAVVEVPFAYNHRVSGNVLVVTLTAKVSNQAVTIGTLLRGPVLITREAHELAQKSYGGVLTMPGRTPARSPQVLYRGSSAVEIAFAFPDAETARAAGGDLRPLGHLSPMPGRGASGVLFQVRTKEREVYQGEIHFKVLADLKSPEVASSSSEPVPPKPATRTPGALSAEELEKLRINLIKWREERKNLALIYLPEHPRLREMDERIQATETVIDALKAGGKDFPAAPAPDPPTMDTSDAALRMLPWQVFDQTPGQYWRQLADVRRFREAAVLMERYLALHPELEESSQRINGANLHFHAAQCHAFAGNREKALGHLALSRHAGAEAGDGLLWNVYVDGTEAFLREDHAALVQAHVRLTKGSSENRDNLCVLDRLLAGFGKSYVDAYESDANADHTKLSADFFNRAWELLDKPNRTTGDGGKMIAYSHASLAHWRMRDDVTPRHLSIAYWQLSRIYAVLGQAANAMDYARLCFSVSKDLPQQEHPFYFAYSNEAMARAARLLGDKASYRSAMDNAKSMLSRIENASDRELVEKDLKELEEKEAPSPTPIGPPREP